MRIHRDERGQTIILVALSLPLLLGFIGIATDVGVLFKDKRTMQTAADAAAIAAALNLSSGTQVASAQSAAAANGYPVGTGVTVAVNNPPTWPGSSYLSSGGTPNGYVEVTITKSESTIFLALFGYPSVNVLARAVAANVGPPAGCVYALGPTATGGLTVTSTVSAPQCNFFSNSNASIAGLSAKAVGAVGTCTGCIPNMAPYSDPLASLPPATCAGGSSNLNIVGGLNRPGCYNGLAPPNYVIQLSPGTYIFTGGVNLSGSGTITGTGVTIFMSSGALNIGPTTIMNLTAPNSASLTYNGILFAQSSSNTSPASITIGPTSSLQGIMYFPGAPLTITTTSTTPVLYTDFIASSLTFSGSGSLNFQDYANAPSAPPSPLSSVILVE